MVQVRSHWKCLMVNFNLAWMAQLPTWIKRIKKKKKSGNFYAKKVETLSPFSEASNLLSQSIGTIKQTYLQKRHQNPSNNTFFFFFGDQKLFFGASSHKQLFCFSHNLCKNPEYHWIRINYVCQRKNGSIISFLDWEISHAQYRQKSALQISTLKHPSSTGLSSWPLL